MRQEHLFSRRGVEDAPVKKSRKIVMGSYSHILASLNPNPDIPCAEAPQAWRRFRPFVRFSLLGDSVVRSDARVEEAWGGGVRSYSLYRVCGLEFRGGGLEYTRSLLGVLLEKNWFSVGKKPSRTRDA